MPLHLLPHLNFLWLIVASLIAGVMNALAGGGSFLSFPAMMGMGVLPVQANATNTVALWPGQLTSIAALRHDLRRELLVAVVCSNIVGGICGAEILLHTRQTTFLHLIPWLILGGTLLFAASAPVSRWLRRRAVAHRAAHDSARFVAAPDGGVRHRWWLGIVLLPVAFYIGYFGAGGGFVVMTILALFGMEEMHQLNAMKVLAGLCGNLCAILVFVLQGAIVWRYCFVAMVFAALGGWAGAHMARRVNAAVLRGIVVATGLLISGYFFVRQAHG